MMKIRWDTKSIYAFPFWVAIAQLVLASMCFYWGYKYQGLAAVSASQALAAEQKIREMICNALNKDVAIGLGQIPTQYQDDMASMLFSFGQLSVNFAAAAMYEIWRRYRAANLPVL